MSMGESASLRLTAERGSWPTGSLPWADAGKPAAPGTVRNGLSHLGAGAWRGGGEGCAFPRPPSGQKGCRNVHEGTPSPGE